MNNKYYYVACEATEQSTNAEFKHYFRLYKTENDEAILVDQGLAEKLPSWENKFKASLNFTNPYPNLD